MPDTKFKDDWGDLDEEANQLAAEFTATPAQDVSQQEERAAAAVKAADATAEKQGFKRTRMRRKRFRRSDSFRTGRNELISIKGHLEDKERVTRTSDERNWVNGQTLQYALDALEEKISNPDDEFWKTHNFHGVD